VTNISRSLGGSLKASALTSCSSIEGTPRVEGV
jgi:hypothetical protein